VPRHPETRPNLDRVARVEAGLVDQALIDAALERAEISELGSTSEGSWD